MGSSRTERQHRPNIQRAVAAVAAGVSETMRPRWSAMIWVERRTTGQVNYKPDYRDFGPRVGIAYHPSSRMDCWGNLRNRKDHGTSGGSHVHDRVLSTLSFELDQQTFLFRLQLDGILRGS